MRRSASEWAWKAAHSAIRLPLAVLVQVEEADEDEEDDEQAHLRRHSGPAGLLGCGARLMSASQPIAARQRISSDVTEGPQGDIGPNSS